MESLETNKVFAAVLLAGIAFVGAGLIANAVVHPHPLKEAAIQIDVPEAAPAGGAPSGAEPPLADLLAKADVGKGEAGVKSQGCVACHTFVQGGKAGVGPNLYNTLGSPHGHMEGYAYSAALKAKEGPWTLDEMNAWLRKPAAYAPGTKMSYAGLGDPQKRADIILYIRSLSASPVALPTPQAAPEAASAPAGASPGVGGPSAFSAGAPATANPDRPKPVDTAPSGVPEPAPAKP